jgi:hypothetical protein
MIFEFLNFIQDTVITDLLAKSDRVPCNYYLLDLAYVLLACLNNTMSTTKIEREYHIPHSSMSEIFTFFERYVCNFLCFFEICIFFIFLRFIFCNFCFNTQF